MKINYDKIMKYILLFFYMFCILVLGASFFIEFKLNLMLLFRLNLCLGGLISWIVLISDINLHK